MLLWYVIEGYKERLQKPKETSFDVLLCVYIDAHFYTFQLKLDYNVNKIVQRNRGYVFLYFQLIPQKFPVPKNNSSIKDFSIL